MISAAVFAVSLLKRFPHRLLGVLPPPCGGGLGRGVVGFRWHGRDTSLLPPPPAPPHKGERGSRLRRGFALIACDGVRGEWDNLAALAQTPPAQAPPSQPRITMGFVEIEGDPRHEPIRAYERLILKTREHPFVGAQVGIDEARRADSRAEDGFRARAHHGEVRRCVASVVVAARETRGIQFFIVDAPAGAFKPLAAAVRGRDVLLFNATAPRGFAASRRLRA